MSSKREKGRVKKVEKGPKTAQTARVKFDAKRVKRSKKKKNSLPINFPARKNKEQ